jgi:protein O-mannosyl-transferase
MKPAPAKNIAKPPVQKKQTGNPTQKKAELKFDLSETQKWAILIGLVVFTFVLYGNTIMHGYALDDDIITRHNSFVQQGISGIGHIFSKGYLYGFNGMNDQSYRPVTLTSIAIEKQFFGSNPHVFHFFNVFWYAITAIFLFLTLLKIFRKYNYILPLFITLLFIAQPVHTEVVANIKSRDEILSFLFCIMALYCSLQYYIYKQPNYYKFLSWALFFLAILSKETALMYFIIIPMVYYFFTELPLEKIFMLAVPFVALVVIYMILRGRILDSITFNEQMQVINNSIMAAKTPADKLATTIFILGKYIWLLFVPLALTFDYSFKQIPIVSLSSPEALISIAVYAGLIGYALFRLKRKDPVSFGILYFIITMFLVSNLFVKIGSSMGERFLYTSSLGFCIAIGWLIIQALKIKIDTLRPNITILYAVAGAILLGYSVKTIARNGDWESNYTLFQAGVITSPNSARAHQSMAITYTDTAINTNDPVAKANFFSKAIIEYNAALKILPGYSEALYNMGWNYYSMANFDSAAVAFQKCINADPRYLGAYQDLGVIYFNRKEYPKAISVFEAGLTESPNNPDMCENIGAAFFNIGRYDSAVVYLKTALNGNPNLNSARETLAKAQNAMRTTK